MQRTSGNPVHLPAAIAGLLLALASAAQAGYIVETIADVAGGSEGFASYNQNGATSGANISTNGVGATASGTLDTTGLDTFSTDMAGVNSNNQTGAAFAQADIASGTLRTSASNTVGSGALALAASATAFYSDSLSLVIPTNNPNTVTPIAISLGYHGLISSSAPSNGGNIFDEFFLSTGGFNYLFEADIEDGGPGNACSVSFVPCFNVEQETGWQAPFGTLINSPGDIIFEGVIDVFGEHPIISLSDEQILNLSGAPASFDFSNTSTVTVTVPDGVTYTSASGVFGTESATPEPGSFALLGLGIAWVAVARRRRA